MEKQKKGLFHKCYEESGFSYQDSNFDWSLLNLPGNLYKVNQTKRLEEIDELGNISSQDTCSFASTLGLENDASNQLSTHPTSSTHDSTKTESREDNSEYKTEGSDINKIDFIDEKRSSNSKLKVRSPTNSKIIRGKSDLEGMTKSLSDVDLHSHTLGQASGHVTTSKEAHTSSHGYYSNSSTSAANSLAVMHGAVVRRKVERSPADRLLRSVDFDAIERLTCQEEKQRVNPNRVTLREKRLSLLCFQWRKRYKSVFYNNDDESTEYRPAPPKSKDQKQ